jgi:hypothetical protein
VENIELPERLRRLRIPASEFARVYDKPVQTVHNWAKSGVIQENCGCGVEVDPTGHLFIWVPSTHEFHKIFLYRKSLAFALKRSLRQWKLIKEEGSHDIRKAKESLQNIQASFHAWAIYKVTGWTGLGPAPTSLTEEQSEQIQRMADGVFQQFFVELRKQLELQKLQTHQIHN